jgi:hypothetical protein
VNDNLGLLMSRMIKDIIMRDGLGDRERYRYPSLKRAGEMALAGNHADDNLGPRRRERSACWRGSCPALALSREESRN